MISRMSAPRGWFAVDLALATAKALDLVRKESPIVAVLEGSRSPSGVGTSGGATNQSPEKH